MYSFFLSTIFRTLSTQKSHYPLAEIAALALRCPQPSERLSPAWGVRDPRVLITLSDPALLDVICRSLEHRT